MLDHDPTDLISKVSEYITDSIWLGKANFLLRRLKVNKDLNNKTRQAAEQLIRSQNDENIKRIYLNLKDNMKIKWKESIKKVVGIKIPLQKGMDI
ncbi:hypothetical protein KAU33_10550 [Candidatus Dependentiae bacterium]|nr:hypothetical protein [Candidatus Dependentiae bacterium]